VVVAAQRTPPLPIAILYRLSFLPADELELLGLASVLGTSFSASDLALVSHRPVADLLPALRAARRAGVLHELDGRLAFRHDLIRDALYEDMPLSVRRALHSELASLFAEAGEPPERMTDHLLRAAVPGDAKSLASLVAAARELAPRAPSAAVELFSRAIEVSPQPAATRADLLPELAETLVTAGLLSEGEAACREAIERGLEAEVAARLRLKLAMLLTRRPRTGAALREAETALAADGGKPLERARLRGWLALARFFEGDIDGAVSEATAVIGSAPDRLARALALDTLALAASADGRFLESAKLIGESARDVEALGSREAYDSCPHMILGLQLARLDRLDEAYTAIQRGRRASEGLGMVDTLASFHYQLALVEMLRGRLDDALAELATHADYAEQTGAGWNIPADSVRSLIALHRGDLLAAEEHVSRAERAAADGAPRHGIDRMVVARARVLEATGQTPSALDMLAGAVHTGDASYYPVIGPDLARLAALMHEPERAAGIVQPLERVASLNPGVRSLEAARLQAHGWLEGDASALLAAAALLRETGRTLEAARAAEHAAAAIAQERGDGARELLDEARAAYEKSGATHDLARADAALRSLGARRGVRGPRQRPSSGWESLTDTELKVVRLVAERLTNPEIAERLFISRRTVQTHVSHALTKLSVPSRRELAAEAARRAGWRIRVEGERQELEQPEPADEPPAGTVVNSDDT
jgi:DNA-binding CsgD family transcriptional regulator